MRDIVENMLAQSHRLFHLGSAKLSRSNLARINEDKPAGLYEALFGKLLQRCQSIAPAHEKVNDTQVRLDWDSLDNADGYKLFFTTDLGYEPIQSADVGNTLELTTPLDPNTSYTVALQAYNSQCTGVLSEPVTVLLSQQ